MEAALNLSDDRVLRAATAPPVVTASTLARLKPARVSLLRTTETARSDWAAVNVPWAPADRRTDASARADATSSRRAASVTPPVCR